MAIQINDDLLTQLGLAQLPQEEKAKMLKQIYDTLEMRVGMKLAEQMTDAQLTEFESFVNTNDEQGAFRWLESNFPNYKDVVANEFENLKKEIAGVAPQILQSAASQGQPAGVPAPMGAPGQQPYPQQGYDQQPPQNGGAWQQPQAAPQQAYAPSTPMTTQSAPSMPSYPQPDASQQGAPAPQFGQPQPYTQQQPFPQQDWQQPTGGQQYGPAPAPQQDFSQNPGQQPSSPFGQPSQNDQSQNQDQGQFPPQDQQR